MKFQILKKNHKKELIIGALIICLLSITVVFATTRAKYKIGKVFI